MKQRVGFARRSRSRRDSADGRAFRGARSADRREPCAARGGSVARPSTGVNTLVVVTHSGRGSVFLAGRIVVFGSQPGHVREELSNPLPIPTGAQPRLRDDGGPVATRSSPPRSSRSRRRRAAPQRLIPSHGACLRGDRSAGHCSTRPDGRARSSSSRGPGRRTTTGFRRAAGTEQLGLGDDAGGHRATHGRRRE